MPAPVPTACYPKAARRQTKHALKLESAASAIQKSFAREGEGDLEITHHIAIEVDTKHAVECSFFC